MASNESLISDSYKKANQKLHESSNYGNVNQYIENKTLNIVRGLAKAGFCKSVLDYGCGRGSLVELLTQNLPGDIRVDGYDPGNTKYDKAYKPADVVTSYDVLEHIERSKINEVLNDIHSYTKNYFICIIDLLPAIKNLEDGRNAHILLAPPGWWLEKLSERFEMGHYYIHDNGPLNQKLCFVGCKRKDTPNISSQVFYKTFF